MRQTLERNNRRRGQRRSATANVPSACVAGQRRGTALIMALMCLVLLTMLLGSLLQTAVGQRKQMRFEERRLQAVWLAESAVERAAGRLAADRDYQGETWQITADELGGQFSAAVTISVRTPEDIPDRRLIAVEAHYPVDQTPFRQTRQIAVDLPAVSQ